MTHERITESANYDSFYEKLPATQRKTGMERCHQEFIERRDKPERRLVLQGIDCKDQIAEELSIDSFICGFHLACKLCIERNMYEKTSTRSIAAGRWIGCSLYIWE